MGLTEPFGVIDGGRDERTFVCPWCGATFTRRFIASDGVESLEEHWAGSPECSANRDTNNPTQSKYVAVDPDPEHLVRLIDGGD
jgi:hypothetical protein